VLGTPSSGTLTSCTGLPISTGVSGLGTGVATLLGGASSGTGGPAGTTSPTFITPVLGTPSSGTLTSCTGLPLGGQLSNARPVRNILINGDMRFSQRYTTATTACTTDKYYADRWRVCFTAGGISEAPADTNSGTDLFNQSGIQSGLQARYYSQYKQTASTHKVMVVQPIENFDCTYLRGRTVTCQAKIKTGTSANVAIANTLVRFGLIELGSGAAIDTFPANIITAEGSAGIDPTLGTNLTYSTSSLTNLVGGSVSGNALSCTSSTTWTQFAFKVTLGTTFKNIAIVIWADGLTLTGPDILGISEVGLFDGDQVRDYLPCYDDQQELARCQRFYEKSFALANAPANSSTDRSYQICSCYSTTTTTAMAANNIPFKVSKHANPTITFYSPSDGTPSAGFWSYFISGAWVAGTGTSVLIANENCFMVNVVATGLTATQALPCAGGWTAESEL
jgi:hypothetical protein